MAAHGARQSRVIRLHARRTARRLDSADNQPMPKPPSKHRRAIVREQLANPQRTKSRAQIAAAARAWRKIQRRADAGEIIESLASGR